MASAAPSCGASVKTGSTRSVVSAPKRGIEAASVVDVRRLRIGPKAPARRVGKKVACGRRRAKVALMPRGGLSILIITGLGLASCGRPELSATAVCGESLRPGSAGALNQMAVLTTDFHGQLPDRRLHVVWLCNSAELCDPVFSFDQARDLRVHWLDRDTLEIVSDASAPREWPAPPAPRNAPWPQVKVKLVQRDRPDSPPLEHHLSPGLGKVLNTAEPCAPIRRFKRLTSATGSKVGDAIRQVKPFGVELLPGHRSTRPWQVGGLRHVRTESGEVS